MFRYNVNNINVRKENIISVCVPIKGLWRHSWRQKAIFPKSITWCLLTHQTCKEGRFSQPLWFCDWYTKTCCQHYLLRQSYTQPGSLFVQNPPKTSRKWAGVPDTGMLEFSVSERCEVFCWGEMFYLIINQTSWNVYTVMAFQ